MAESANQVRIGGAQAIPPKPMGPANQIRLARADEAPIVHRVMVAAFEEYREAPVPSSALNETVESIAAALNDGIEQALLYMHCENAVGCTRFKSDAYSLYFLRLSVLPEARGQGIAKSMLRWLEDYAWSHGVLEIWCRVRKMVPRNIELYKSIGFVVTKEEEVMNPNGFPVQTVVMRKQLIHPEAYVISVAAAVCVRGGRLLMVLQGQVHEEKSWSIPGGVRNDGESFEACCVREAEEETGYLVAPIKLIHTKAGGAIRYFAVDVVGGERKVQDPDNLIYEIAWKTAEEIQSLPLTYEEDREFLLACLRK